MHGTGCDGSWADGVKVDLYGPAVSIAVTTPLSTPHFTLPLPPSSSSKIRQLRIHTCARQHGWIFHGAVRPHPTPIPPPNTHMLPVLDLGKIFYKCSDFRVSHQFSFTIGENSSFSEPSPYHEFSLFCIFIGGGLQILPIQLHVPQRVWQDPQKFVAIDPKKICSKKDLPHRESEPALPRLPSTTLQIRGQSTPETTTTALGTH